jgi:large subunit ribosomal protein L15
MQSHTIQRNTPQKRKVSVGRGGKRGKTSGRGTKGQNARSGRKKRPELRDIIKKLPKLRGRGVGGGKSFREKATAVNLDLLEKNFSAGSEITPKILAEKGLISERGGHSPFVKILSEGDLTKKITVKGCAVSAGAKEKIEKAGGTVENS